MRETIRQEREIRRMERTTESYSDGKTHGNKGNMEAQLAKQQEYTSHIQKRGEEEVKKKRRDWRINKEIKLKEEELEERGERRE